LTTRPAAAKAAATPLLRLRIWDVAAMSATDGAPGADARTPMRRALAEAERAAALGEVPVGAVLLDAQGRVLASRHNRVETDRDATAHAELLALRAGMAARGDKHLEGCDLYVTLEPCAMCAAALALARVRRVYFGAYDPKSGGVEHGARVFDRPQCHWRPEVIGGLEERACAALLARFFRDRR
jgi:tRNA(Arg) A34 adenosine deaminase TadA